MKLVKMLHIFNKMVENPKNKVEAFKAVLILLAVSIVITALIVVPLILAGVLK